MRKILHLKMGGTIDSDTYPPEYQPDATPNGHHEAHKALKAILAEGAPDAALEYREVCDLDSKRIGEAQKEALYVLVGEAERDESITRIIITTGTDCMTELGQDLAMCGFGSVKPIVFTGAIWPLLNGEKSDGRENLSSAAFTDAKAGIYIAMGEVFDRAENVRKDFENKVFVADKGAAV